MARPSGRGLRAAVRAGAAVIIAAVGWYGYQFPHQVTWLPPGPGILAVVAVGSYVVCAAAARLGWPRGVLSYGPVETPQGERPGIVARLRAGAVGVQLAALTAIPAATGLVVGVSAAQGQWSTTVVGGLLGLLLTLTAAHAARRIIQRGLTIGITGTGVRMGGHFMPWAAIDKTTLSGGTVTIAIERPPAVQPPLAGLRPTITLPAGLLRVPAEPLVAAMEFYRRNPPERARLAYPYPAGSPVVLP